MQTLIPAPSVIRKIMAMKSLWLFLAAILFQVVVSIEVSAAPGMTMPSGVADKLAAGAAQELIIEFDDTAINQEISLQKTRMGNVKDDAAILALRASRYKALKAQVLTGMPQGEYDTLIDYGHLPMAFLRIHTQRALDVLSQHALVKAIYKNEKKYPILAQSLPLIDQPVVAAAGEVGTGTTAVVVDTGVDYTRSAFGLCTAPGVPASCKVNYYQNIADTNTTLDANGHGTNVSAIVLGVAPDTRIAMLNVFGANTSTSDALIIQAMDWAIANQVAYHVAAINLSLGDGVDYTKACSANNPYVTPVKNASAAGIITVAASGNNAYTNGISSPACTPGAVSVGAVYDANVGGLTYSMCTDATTAADQITCFSNSASFLTLLAPGALITAGGYTMAGTSQATPHVVGAIAVLRAAYPSETLTQTIARLTSTGKSITDLRNGIVKPRIDLLAAARPSNDAFANRFVLTASSGSAAGINTLATKEAGEPVHAGNAGGASVWWKWTAPASGQVYLDTHGSSFNTLLAVYLGSAVGSLSSVASNDNDSSANNTSGLYFEAQAGTEYEIAVDGYNGASGKINLDWSLNTAANADISVAMTSGFSEVGESNLVYNLVVTNNGPQIATNVNLTVTLAPNLSVMTLPPGCVASGSIVTCSIGTLANGAASNVQITAALGANGNYTTTASASSDLPDPGTANNSLPVTTAVTDYSNDVPALPFWGEVMMGALLLSSMYLRLNRK